MAHRSDPGRRLFVGRDAELKMLRDLIEQACAGKAGAFLVFGDAGVGKSALVQQACADAEPATVKLAGACLPLRSLNVPFLGLRSALDAVSRQPDLPTPPRLGGADSTGNVPLAFDRWLAELYPNHPVVLVVDDLQWADEPTLDLLMYLLAGPADRPLAMLITVRSPEVTEGHPLHRWLADVVRLPGVHTLGLDPLERVDSEALIGGVLGAVPHQGLVEDVFSRARGNPYLIELLVRGLTPDATALPPNLPADLTTAVLRSWHQLSVDTRQLMSLLAIGGEPATLEALASVADRVGVPASPEMIREATSAGLLDVGERTGYWFHHPIQAQVLQQALDPELRRAFHTAFADQAEVDISGNPAPSWERLAGLVDHHNGAGRPAQAYAWALRTTQDEALGNLKDARDQTSSTLLLQLLERLVVLREELPEARESRVDLLLQLKVAAERAGAVTAELDAVDALLPLIDTNQRPLLAAELLVRRMMLRMSAGKGFAERQDVLRAVVLSSAQPRSWQHALAGAEDAHTGLWHGDESAVERAGSALRLARAAGHPGALSLALTANAMAALIGHRMGEAAELAQEAVEAAIEARDFWAFVHASLWEANATEDPDSQAYAEHIRSRREQLEALGGPHTWAARMSAGEAFCWLMVGEWRACSDRLRVALSSAPGPMADVETRLTAALLAAWQGRVEEAQSHLERADEMFDEQSTFLAFPFAAVRAVVLLAAGRSEDACRVALAGASTTGLPPTLCEWLLPLAARSLANVAEAARDAGQAVGPVLERLAAMRAEFPEIISDVGELTKLSSRRLEAQTALYEAETARARRDGDAGVLWMRAADSCRDGSLPWQEVYACWRAAEALLSVAAHERDRAAAALRRGHHLARRLHAIPIQSEIEALSRSARISLAEVQRSEGGTAAPALGALTPREREVLAHIVAGRTYAEIARALVLSEKTVSSHVSNLLRKTGTSGRVELSRLVTRVGG